MLQFGLPLASPSNPSATSSTPPTSPTYLPYTLFLFLLLIACFVYIRLARCTAANMLNASGCRTRQRRDGPGSGEHRRLDASSTSAYVRMPTMSAP